MVKENLSRQIGRWVAEKLDRVFGPKPTKSEPPKNLSKRAQYVWAHTADTAVNIVNEFRFLNNFLTLEEEALLKTAIHERIIKDLKKEDYSNDSIFTEVEKWLEKRPSYLINLYAKQTEFDTENPQVRRKLTFWQLSVVKLATDLMDKKDINQILEDQKEIQKKRRNLFTESKTPFGLPVPGAE